MLYNHIPDLRELHADASLRQLEAPAVAEPEQDQSRRYFFNLSYSHSMTTGAASRGQSASAKNPGSPTAQTGFPA
ncbi:hypothetical protein ACFWZK_06675 [[Kitasatospora] papulosa]|uniref:hypothetical protein n=1 Tax=[Kitasatospora] papulosa TaxID=1464011 RepID=UPI00367DA513